MMTNKELIIIVFEVKPGEELSPFADQIATASKEKRLFSTRRGWTPDAEVVRPNIRAESVREGADFIARKAFEETK